MTRRAVAFVALVLLLISGYNRLVAMRQNCNQGWADIDAQLKQRHDLVPNLVATVQGYAAHEKSTLDAVIAARNSAVLRTIAASINAACWFARCHSPASTASVRPGYSRCA